MWVKFWDLHKDYLGKIVINRYFLIRQEKGNIRCNDNMDKTNILILDYDDAGYSYQEFEDRFRGYKYFLHTSYSYNTDD